MLNKLAFRNAKRSMRDYVVYLITMSVIATLMFAFNAMIFSKDVMGMCSEATVMIAMLGLATLFIVLIVAWLINYMTRFMLEKRSREFGTYLLLGMKRKEISKIYIHENVLVGTIGFSIGGICSVFLKQIIMTIFYNVFGENYHVKVDFSIWTLVMTFCCYFGCYMLALFRNKKKFKKMNIADLMRMEKENEKIKQGGEIVKLLLFFASLAYMVFFFYELFDGHYSVGGVILMSVLMIVSIYFMYIGFTAFIVIYVKKGGKRIYAQHNLFILRQLSSKLNTMKFTMGTLTILLTCALLGGTVAMMFGKYQDRALKNSMPFDVIVYSNNVEDDFKDEIKVIDEEGGIKDQVVYYIYQNGSKDMNNYMYTHAETINKKYRNSDGSVNEKAVKKDGYEYYDYDTYISLSDYNHLRKMLGYKEISLNENEYAIQIKERLKDSLNKEIKARIIETENADGNVSLKMSDVFTESISQSGINGADYLIVVPDSVASVMTPYYKNLAIDLISEPEKTLQSDLEKIRHKKNGIMPEKEFDKLQDQGKIEEDEIWDDVTLGGSGTDQIVVVVSDVLVAGVLNREMKFVLTAIVFPLVYVGFVFVCVALTILAVQQLSDSNKYRFRYDVLRKLGLSEKDINKLVFRQLFAYYMVPGVVSLVLSGIISIYAGNNFVRYTGAIGNGLYYFGIAVALFFGIYFIYFVVTYVGFKKNISK